jgi:hypothetical protein
LRRCLVAAIAIVAGCAPADRSKDPEQARATSALASSQGHTGAIPGFTFLSPIVRHPRHGTGFVSGLFPVVTIEELGGRGILATFTRSLDRHGGGDSRVREDGERYFLVWDAKDSGVRRPFVYRIRVQVDGVELGFADAQVVRGEREIELARMEGLVPLADEELPIAFRIEPEALTTSRCTGVVCAPPDQCHDAGVCDPATGTCSNPARPDGSACSDGNACTQVDTCQGGSCVGAASVTCTPPGPCHVGTCSVDTGSCSYAVVTDGTACSNGGSTPAACQQGVCTGAADYVPDPARTVSRYIGNAGGTIHVVASSGVVYDLEIPPLALSQDTVVSVTPISGLSGLPFAMNPLGAVLFSPEGLSFIRPATLTITGPAAAGGPIVGFRTGGDGSGLELVPAWVQGASVRLDIPHFSTAGAGPTNCESLPVLKAIEAAAVGFTRIQARIVRTQLEAVCLFSGDLQWAYMQDAGLLIEMDWYGEILADLQSKAVTLPVLKEATRQALLMMRFYEALGIGSWTLPLYVGSCGLQGASPLQNCRTPEDLEAQVYIDIAFLTDKAFRAADEACRDGDASKAVEYIDALNWLCRWGFEGMGVGQVLCDTRDSMAANRRCGAVAIALLPGSATVCRDGPPVPFELLVRNSAGNPAALPSNVSTWWKVVPDGSLRLASGAGENSKFVQGATVGTATLGAEPLTPSAYPLFGTAAAESSVTVALCNVAFDPPTVNLRQGGASAPIRVVVSDELGNPVPTSGCNWSWAVSDASVATVAGGVGDTATVTPVAPGTTSVSASCNGLLGSTTVTVAATDHYLFPGIVLGTYPSGPGATVDLELWIWPNTPAGYWAPGFAGDIFVDIRTVSTNVDHMWSLMVLGRGLFSAAWSGSGSGSFSGQSLGFFLEGCAIAGSSSPTGLSGQVRCYWNPPCVIGQEVCAAGFDIQGPFPGGP